jgi:hypothetical protein
MENRYGGMYPPVLAWTVIVVATLVALVTGVGRERRGGDMTKTH